MKISLISILVSLSVVTIQQQCSAFVVTDKYPSTVVTSSRGRSLVIVHDGAAALEPEPEGGQEVTALKSLDETKVKNMGELDDVSSDNGTVYNFWMSTVAKGELVKSLHGQVLRESKKKANFPGFRKGQVPPFAMPQIKSFAVQQAIIDTVQAVVDAYGLQSLPGSDGEFEVKEDIPEITKSYTVGDDLPFTATMKATFDPEKVKPSETEDGDDGVIDVEVESSE